MTSLNKCCSVLAGEGGGVNAFSVGEPVCGASRRGLKVMEEVPRACDCECTWKWICLSHQSM